MNSNVPSRRSSGFGAVGIVARFPMLRGRLIAWALFCLVAAATLFLIVSGPGVSAATTRTLVDGETFPNGFTVPAGEVWQFDANADTKVTTSGNVVVLGTLRMRPAKGSVEHFLQFTGIDESKFVGGGHSNTSTPNDIGLWVEGAGVLDISGTPVTPWSYEWESDWSSADDIVAAPNKTGDFTTFAQVNSAEAVPSANALGYKPELLNLTRNVRIEGTAGGRTHILIHAPDAKAPQTIKYAAIRYVAPWLGGTDATGRYGLHFHHNGYATAGSKVEGVVIRDADNHAFVPHASHGVTFTDTIAYGTTDAAYWWDESTAATCGDVEGCNETFDVVYDSIVVADNVASDVSPHESTAISLGGGENLTITDSVVVGMNGSSGANTSAFKWPSKDRGVWTFANNIAHNNKGHGIFVWQNTTGDDDENHVIEDFTAFYNANAGIDHGAYGNAYVYRNITLLGNALDAKGVEQNAAIHSHALGKESATTTGPGATDTQEWNGVTTGGAKMVVFFHGTDTDEVRFLFCDFSEIVFDEGPNSFPGAYDFIECNLDVGDFDRSDIHPGTVIRVQDGNSAYKLVGTGSKQTISTFYADPQLDQDTTVDRWWGADRYKTAVATSKANFPFGADAVIIATGLNYPDAVAAASLAEVADAPILLVAGGKVPGSTLTEVKRLDPSKIYILGGTAAVPNSAENVLDDVAPVTRLAGADRYLTAIEISKEAHPGPVNTVYLAAGTSFVEGLVGGPVAASSGNAILLVPSNKLPSALKSELNRLSPSKIVVLGGGGIVSQSVVDQLESYANSVESIAGSDRYHTGVLVSKHGFPGGAETVLIATGALFPDGLSASGVAGDLHAPVLLVKPDSLPSSVANELVRLDPSQIRILGGSAAISDSVEAAIENLFD